MSESDTETDNQGENTSALEGPGKLLREARKKAELSIADVAGRMHLESRIITAIEQDDYGNLPTATYSRGYLRSYAKLLNLDADHVISLYDSDAPDPPEIHPEVKHPSQISSNDKPVKAFTYLITLSLALLLLIWIQSNYVEDKPINTADIGLEPKEAVPPAFDYEFTIVNHSDDWTSSSATASNTTPDKKNIETIAEDKIVPTSPTETIASTGESNTPETSSSDIDITNGFVPPRAQDGPDNLVIKVSADSWMEISDAKSGRIYTDLVKAGRTIILKGTAPFSVLLGNGKSAEVSFNGNSYFQDSFNNEGVSRFKVGE